MPRHRLLIGLCLVVLSGMTPAETAAAPRFQLQGQLQAAPAARSDGRFSLRASLSPSSPRPDAHARFLVVARLENDTQAKGACSAPDRIFGNGFEDP